MIRLDTDIHNSSSCKLFLYGPAYFYFIIYLQLDSVLFHNE